MLNIATPHQLARLLEVSARRLYAVCDYADAYYQELVLSDPAKPDKKPRMVESPKCQMRSLQQCLYHRVLALRLDRSPYSHGGVPGRNILSNARPHVGQRFLFTTDIANFYPSVHWTRVLKLFAALNCSEPVARICTRICTYKNHLSQGLLTSPILADQLMRPVDERIGSACQKLGAVYTRYVDDLAVSAPFDLQESGVPGLVYASSARTGLAPTLISTSSGQSIKRPL
jgi:hypothetical protein